MQKIPTLERVANVSSGSSAERHTTQPEGRRVNAGGIRKQTNARDWTDVCPFELHDDESDVGPCMLGRCWTMAPAAETRQAAHGHDASNARLKALDKSE